MLPFTRRPTAQVPDGGGPVTHSAPASLRPHVAAAPPGSYRPTQTPALALGVPRPSASTPVVAPPPSYPQQQPQRPQVFARGPQQPPQAPPGYYPAHFGGADPLDQVTPPPYSLVPVAMSELSMRGASATGSHRFVAPPPREKPSLKWGILIAMTGAVLGGVLGVGMDSKRTGPAAASQVAQVSTASTAPVQVAVAQPSMPSAPAAQAAPLAQPPLVQPVLAPVAVAPVAEAPAAPVAVAEAPVAIAAPAVVVSEPVAVASTSELDRAADPVAKSSREAPKARRAWSRPAPRAAKVVVPEAKPEPKSAKVAKIAIAEAKPEPKPEPKVAKVAVAAPPAKKAEEKVETKREKKSLQSEAERLLADAIKDTTNTL